MPEEKVLEIDGSLRELCEHGDAQFPVEVFHDHLGEFRDHFIPCHWHDEWEFSIVRRGTPLYQINGVPQRISPGAGVLINSGVTHMAIPEGQEPVELLTVIVHPRFLSESPGSAVERNCVRPFCQAGALAGVFLPPETDWGKRVLDGCDEIDRLAGEKPWGYELGVKGLLCECLFHILTAKRGEIGRPEGQGDDQRLKVMLSYLHEHYAEKLSLAGLAAQIPVTKEACCRLFRRSMGMTVSQYLADYRVQQSISLLESGRYSVLEVSSLVGFSNASRYAAAFRSRMRCGPVEYLHRQRPPARASGASKSDRR